MLLYAGLPAGAVAAAMLLLLIVPIAQFKLLRYPRVLVPITLAAGLVPLAVLSSFILRAATVTRRTAATVPFTAPERET